MWPSNLLVLFFSIAQAEAFDFEHYFVQLTLLDLSDAERPTVSV